MKTNSETIRSPDLDLETAAATKLWVVLARAYRAVADRARRDIEERGLGITEFAVLEALYHRGPLTLGEVGNKVLLTSGSITYVVDKLEQRGLLERRPCPEDRRVTYAEISDAGRELIAEIFPAHATAIREATDGLTLKQKQTAADLLRRLGRHAAGSES